MTSPPTTNEQQRQQYLHLLDALDPELQHFLNELTKLAAMICNAPMAALSLIDQKRHLLKATHGIKLNETSRDQAFFVLTIPDAAVFEIEDARKNDRFRNLDLVCGKPGVVFFAGASITVLGGLHIGTLCVMDRKSRKLSQIQRQTLQGLAYQVSVLLQLTQKNAGLRTVAQQAQFGFLTIDRDLSIQSGSSKYCETIFKTPPQPGQCLLDLLRFDKSRATLFRMAVQQIFEDILPESVSLKLIPKAFKIGSRHYQLAATVVRNHKQSVSALLFTILDCTEKIQIENEAGVNRALLRVAREKTAFKAFCLDCDKDFKVAVEALKDQDFDRYNVILHTLKGNFSSFGLDMIANLIHDLEDEAYPDISHIKRIQSAFEDFLAEAQIVLGISIKPNQPNFLQIRTDDLDHLKRLIEQSEGIPLHVCDAIQEWMTSVRRVDFEALLSHTITSCYSWAASLGKQLDIQLTNPKLPVDPELLRPITKNLVHLLNNSIDHGIEPPQERGTKGAVGKIRIHCEYLAISNDLLIVVEDDGRGIDPDSIRQTALRKCLRTEQELSSLSDAETILLIFEPGFSTSKEVSALSGRGVGMSALRDSLLNVGGDIQIESVVGQGTKMSLKIPTHKQSESAA